MPYASNNLGAFGIRLCPILCPVLRTYYGLLSAMSSQGIPLCGFPDAFALRALWEFRTDFGRDFRRCEVEEVAPGTSVLSSRMLTGGLNRFAGTISPRPVRSPKEPFHYFMLRFACDARHSIF